MPFKSKAQQGYMFVHHPKMAKKYAEKTPDMNNLPEKVKGSHKPSHKSKGSALGDELRKGSRSRGY